MPADFDVIVVGGGHNGLVCAAYLAQSGLSVCVLERHTRVGGAAVTEEFHPGFRNSVASYTVSLLQTKVIADLELAAHGLRIRPRPLDNFVPAIDGPGLKLAGDTQLRRNAIAAHSTSDAERYEGFAAELSAITQWLRPMVLEAPLDPRQGFSQAWQALRCAASLRRLTIRQLRAARELLKGSAGHWLDRHFETGLLKGGLGFDSVVGHFASPYQAGSAYLLLHHAFGEVNGKRGAWGHAVGGMGAISDALAGAARGLGVDIRVGVAVESIEPEGGGFCVRSSAGVLRAQRVASAIHPQTLFLSLLPSDALPAHFLARIRAWRSESATFRINVALSELPQFRCEPGAALGEHHTAGIIFAPELAYLDRAYEDAAASGYSRAPVIELLIPSTIDDSLAPPGAHVASLFCQHFRRHLPAGHGWDASKAAAIERIVATVDAYAPNFRRSIVAMDAYSPADLERRFGLVGGDIFHGVMSPDQLYWSRPARGFSHYRSPVPGLYMCASGTHPGGGVTGAPGHNAAQTILSDLRGQAVRPPRIA
jgi:phytoene dehydrogenase-like protein